MAAVLSGADRPLWPPLLAAPTPLAFHDKLKKLGERRIAPTHRGFVAAIS